jgi:hypothetical protein
MLFVTSPACPMDFMISAPGYIGLIRLRLTERKSGTLAWIVKEYARSIAELAAQPCGGPVSYELWLYTRHGGLRFFRITGAGIEEIDRSCILSRIKAEGSGPASGEHAESADDSGTSTPQIGTEDAGVPDPNRKFRRWLAKRNAALKATGKTNVLDPVVMALMTKTGMPAADTKREAGKNSGGPGTVPVPGKIPEMSEHDTGAGKNSGEPEDATAPGKIPEICKDNAGAGKKPGGNRAKSNGMVAEKIPETDGPGAEAPVIPASPTPELEGDSTALPDAPQGESVTPSRTGTPGSPSPTVIGEGI